MNQNLTPDQIAALRAQYEANSRAIEQSRQELAALKGQSVQVGDQTFSRVEVPDEPGLYIGPRGERLRVTSTGNVEMTGGAAAGGQGSPLFSAEARSRIVPQFPALVEAEQRFSDVFDSGYRLEDDWGALALDAIGADPLARAMGGEDYQRQDSARRTFEAALLPILSGAAVTETEARRARRGYFPQIFEGDETLLAKQRARQGLLNAYAVGLGLEIPFPDAPVLDLNSVAGGAPLGMTDDQAELQANLDAVPQVARQFGITPSDWAIMPENEREQWLAEEQQ